MNNEIQHGVNPLHISAEALLECSMNTKRLLSQSRQQGRMEMAEEIGKNSDGYHTFDELYEHRHLLFLNLIEYHTNAWKSKLHDDATTFEGWFIAGIELPTGMITYHLPTRLWDVANVTELEKAPKWDGHTPQDVCDRLLKQITRTPPTINK